MTRIYIYSLLLFTLYISITHSADIVIYATQTTASTFSVSLSLPAGNSKSVCVEGRVGNSTAGEPDMKYCSISSFSGWRPDLCTYPISFDIIWTIVAVDAPNNTALSVVPVSAIAMANVTGSVYEVLDTEIIESTEVCCGSSAIHRLSVFTDEPDNWGGPCIRASIETYFYLHVLQGNISNTEFFLQRSPCGPPVKVAAHDEGSGEYRTIMLSAPEFRNYSWGDWYLVMKPLVAGESFQYAINYHMQANPKPCAFSYTSLGVCDGHGVCRDDNGKMGECYCLPCFSGEKCEMVEICSEHGLCNFTSGHCICQDGFTGDTCQFGSTPTHGETLTGGGAALLAIGMFILGSIAGVATLLVVNKKIRRAVYSEVSIQDRESFSKAVS